MLQKLKFKQIHIKIVKSDEFTEFLVRPTRFERATYRVGVCHSIQLGYGYTLDTVHCSTLEQNEQYPKTNISS